MIECSWVFLFSNCLLAAYTRCVLSLVFVGRISTTSFLSSTQGTSTCPRVDLGSINGPCSKERHTHEEVKVLRKPENMQISALKAETSHLWLTLPTIKCRKESGKLVRCCLMFILSWRLVLPAGFLRSIKCTRALVTNRGSGIANGI